MTASLPAWSSPENLTQMLKADGEVEIDGWSPLVITALTGTAYQGQAIDTAWEISLDAGEAPNGEDLDGYGWEEELGKAVEAAKPDLAKRCHWESEMSTFVVWVETEQDCRALAEIIWKAVST